MSMTQKTKPSKNQPPDESKKNLNKKELIWEILKRKTNKKLSKKNYKQNWR